jgi:8-oxo-dGTP diphosphatase
MVLKLLVTKGIIRHNGKYLLLKKIKDIIPENSGKWECSGGRIDKSEDPESALLREVKSETGLNCKVLKELPLLSINGDEFESTCHVFLLEADTDKITLSEEHSEYIWVKPEDVKNMDLVMFADLLLEYFNHAEKYMGE